MKKKYFICFIFILFLKINMSFANQVKISHVEIKESDLMSFIANNKNIDFNVKNGKIHKPYTNQHQLFKIDFEHTKNNILMVDVLVPGKIFFYNKNLEVIGEYPNKNTDNYFPYIDINEIESPIYISRSSNLRFDGNLFLTTREFLKQKHELNDIAMLLFLGSLAFLLLFNLGYFIISKDIVYLHYVLFNLFFGISILIFGSFFNFYLKNEFIQEIQMTTAALSAFFFLSFGDYFLNLKKYISKKEYNIYQYIKFIILTLAIVHFLINQEYKFYISNFIDLFIMIAVFLMIRILFIVKNKNSLSIYYILAWTSQITGTLFLYAYEYTALLDTFAFARYSLLIGCVGEMIINSFGLAYKVKLLEKEKLIAEFNAKQNKKYKNLLRIVCHDIATPLSASFMSLELLKDKINEKETPEQEENNRYFEMASDSLTRMASIIEDVRNKEKERTNKNYYTASEAFKILKDNFVLKLNQKKLDFILEGSEDLVITVQKNELITNILGNVLSNAIKFSPENSKIVMKVKEIGDEVKVSLIDNGVGISEDIIENINNGVCVSKEGTNGEKGTGLGTQIIRELIDEYNGKMEINSKLDKGTDFSILIPKL